MKLTDKIRKALGGMSADDVDARIIAKENEIRELRTQIAEAEEALDEAGLVGKGEEQAAEKLAALRERYRRAPGQLDKLREAQQEHKALEVERQRAEERKTQEADLKKIDDAYQKLLKDVEAFNSVVASTAFSNAPGLKGQRRLRGERYVTQGFVLPDVPVWSHDTLQDFDRMTQARLYSMRQHRDNEFREVAGGTMEAIGASSRRAGEHRAAVEAAEAGDDDARARLALREV